MTAPLALSVRDLVVRYGATAAVRDVSFDIPEGTVLGLVGESGSGKSTVARAVVGLTPPSGTVRTSGTVRIGDVDVSAAPAREARRARRGVQLVFQDSRSSLDPHFTVEQCVLEGLGRRSRARRRERPALRKDGRQEHGGRGRREASARVAELLELVSLDPSIARSRPELLSGGQRQRVAIARALAARPDLLIADEITASLDVSVQAVVLNLLRRLRAELGLTMLFISHNLAIVRYMCDDLAVMRGGRILEYGSVDKVIGRPEDPYTRTLLTAVPEIGRRRLLADDEPTAPAPRS
jgi:peptide/nickel transport system ATP-binding protein